MEEALIATILGGVIAGIFGLITKYLELQFEKKKEEITSPKKDADADGIVTAAEAEDHAEAVTQNFEKREKFSWVQRNFRKLSTGGFIVAGAVVVAIAFMVIIPAVNGGGGNDENALPVTQTSVTEAESVSAVTEKTVSPAEIIAEYKNAVGLLYDEKDVLQGNIFTIRNDNQIYFVTTFRALISSYSEDGTSFKIDFDGNNDILSSDLTLAGYSPLYNIAVLKPNNALDIPAFTLAEKDPIQFAEISVIGTADNEVSKRNIAKKGTITQDNYVNSATGLKGLLTEASCGRMFGAPVLDETDLTKVVAVVPGESTGEDIKLIPVEYIHAVLEEMSNPDTVMKSFPADELPEKFPYSFRYTNSYSATTDFEDIKFTKNDTSTKLYQTKASGFYGLCVSDYNDYVFLNEYDYGQTMYRGTVNDEPVIYYSYEKTVDGGTTFDKSRPYISYTENHKYTTLHDGISKYLRYYSDYKSLWITDADGTSLSATDAYIQYKSDSKYIRIDAATNEIAQNDFESIPEQLVITQNTDGYKLKFEDTVKGFTAYITDDGNYLVTNGTLTAASNADGSFSLKLEGEKPLTANIIEKNINVSYGESTEVVGNIWFSDDGSVTALGIKNGKLNSEYYIGGNMGIFNADKTDSLHYIKTENSIHCGEINGLYYGNGKGIKMSPTYYLIGNFEKGVFDGTYYPYLLDWRDIP